MVTIIQTLTFLLDLYVYIVIAAIMINWMIMLGVVNIQNNLVKKVYYYLNMATAPVFKKLQRIIPPIGGMDFSPIILLIGIHIIQGLLYSLLT